jgi:hypothetical protein
LYQEFFDFIVGTGTGGLIALTLTEQERNLDQCPKTFNAVCKQAYTNETLGEVLLKRVIHTFGSRSRYEASAALCKVLKLEFPDKYDFFGSATRFQPETKVAVIAVGATSRKPTLLSNYRRVGDEYSGQDDDSYHYERPHNPADELKVFQAAYSTVADPKYFAPLSSGRQYSGKSMFSRTPHVALAEARKIWPDIEEPDLLLSLGTGKATIPSKLETKPAKNNSAHCKPWFKEAFEKVQNFTDQYLRSDSDVIDAERTWQQDFVSEITSRTTRLSRRRFIRLNLDIGKLPAQNQESQIQRLSTLVRDKLQDPSVAVLRVIAHRLIATSFYFQAGATRTDVHGRRYRWTYCLSLRR